MIGTFNGIHVVRESQRFAFAVVLEPGLYSIVFGNANKSSVLTRTGEEVEKLCGANYLKFRRRVNGDRVLAVIITLKEGVTLELHRDADSAARAFDEYLAAAVDDSEKEHVLDLTIREAHLHGGSF